MESESDKKFGFNLEIEIKSDKNNIYSLVLNADTYSYLNIKATQKNDLFKKTFLSQFSVDEIKENKYFFMFDDLKEICNELSERIEKKEMKLIENLDGLNFIISLPSTKIKEIKFELKEEEKNDKDKINNLNELILELKEEINEIKINHINEINELKNVVNIQNKEINEIKINHSNEINELKNVVNNLNKEISEIKINHKKEINELKIEHNKEINEIKINQNKGVDEMKVDRSGEINEIKINHSKEINEIKINHNKEINELKNIVSSQNKEINKMKEHINIFANYMKDKENIISGLKNSLIINNNFEYNKLIKKWINPNPNIRIESKLLYRLSRDGDAISKFHELCDNKGSTLTLFETTDGNKGGIYTPLSWDSYSNWKNDLEAFMFNLNKNKKYKKIIKKDSIYCFSDFGPWTIFFGFYKDYQMRKIQHNGTNINIYYENGAECLPNNSGNTKLFDVKEVEVYQIKL